MKKLLFVFVLLALLTMGIAAQDAPVELPDLGGRVITVAVENAYPLQFHRRSHRRSRRLGL